MTKKSLEIKRRLLSWVLFGIKPEPPEGLREREAWEEDVKKANDRLASFDLEGSVVDEIFKIQEELNGNHEKNMEPLTLALGASMPIPMMVGSTN